LGVNLSPSPHCTQWGLGGNMLFPNYFGEALLCNCSGTLGVGFYGNEEMKKGDNSMYTAASDTKDIVNDISTQVCFCEQIYL